MRGLAVGKTTLNNRLHDSCYQPKMMSRGHAIEQSCNLPLGANALTYEPDERLAHECKCIGVDSETEGIGNYRIMSGPGGRERKIYSHLTRCLVSSYAISKYGRSSGSIPTRWGRNTLYALLSSIVNIL